MKHFPTVIFLVNLFIIGITGVCETTTPASNTPRTTMVIIDFAPVQPYSSGESVTFSGVLDYTLRLFVRPVSANLFSSARREDYFLKKNMLQRFSLSQESFSRENPLSDPVSNERQALSPIPDSNTAIGQDLKRFEKGVEYNRYMYTGESDSFLPIYTRMRKSGLVKEVNKKGAFSGDFFTIQEPDFRYLYNDSNPYNYRVNLMTIPPAVVGLSILSSSAQDLDNQINTRIKSTGRFNWKDVHWGRVVASGLSRGLSTSFSMSAESRGWVAGRNTFGGLMIRSLVSGALDAGVRNLGMRYDSKVHNFDFESARNGVLAAAILNSGFNAIQGAVNRYLFKNFWDPAFRELIEKTHGFNPTASAMQKVNRSINVYSPSAANSAGMAGQTANAASDTVTIIPVVDFGWPLIGDDKNLNDSIVIQKNNR
jgi:hypothetical protein